MLSKSGTVTGPRFGPREIPGHDAATFVSARFKGADDADAFRTLAERGAAAATTFTARPRTAGPAQR